MLSVRMDKWLWAARFFKTRALAARACGLGRIRCNGQPAKAAREVHVGVAVETTLAGRNYLQMMLDARNRGFAIVLVYIGTENVEINLARIRSRVLAGVHDVPEQDVRRRYLRSQKNLPLAIQRADLSVLFDNSAADAYRLIAILGSMENRWFEPRPSWITFDV